MTKYQAKLYEVIDKHIHRLDTNAVRKIRISFSGDFNWSPKLTKADWILQYWKKEKDARDISQAEQVLVQVKEIGTEDVVYH